MADEQLADLLKTQIPLTEWMEDIKHRDVELIRREDKNKHQRLGELHALIELPIEGAVQFEALDLVNGSPEFDLYMSQYSDQPCSLRLLPKDDKLPRLRIRGKSVVDASNWAKQQDVQLANYRANFVPHPPDYSWSTIFVVNRHGIQGEIIFGGHHLLTQGFHDQQPILFKYDYKSWQLSEDNPDALAHLQKLAAHLQVSDKTSQKKVGEKLEGWFHHNYLAGYFESTDSSVGTWFIDYNRILGRMFEDVDVPIRRKKSALTPLLTGRAGSNGQAEGEIRIISALGIDEDFQPGQILVCEMTTPNHVPLMKKAAAIITDQGGILCHAAIVARELGIPCIVGTGSATTSLNNGDRVIIDATAGTVLLQP